VRSAISQPPLSGDAGRSGGRVGAGKPRTVINRVLSTSRFGTIKNRRIPASPAKKVASLSVAHPVTQVLSVSAIAEHLRIAAPPELVNDPRKCGRVLTYCNVHVYNVHVFITRLSISACQGGRKVAHSWTNDSLDEVSPAPALFCARLFAELSASEPAFSSLPRENNRCSTRRSRTFKFGWGMRIHTRQHHDLLRDRPPSANVVDRESSAAAGDRHPPATPPRRAARPGRQP
jgi:hypothetical protein